MLFRSSSINLATDMAYQEMVMSIVEEKRNLQPRYVVVIGIGGSNLGTIAVEEAVQGIRPKVLSGRDDEPSMPGLLYADTVDPDSLSEIISIIEPVLQEGQNIIIDLVSKSGTTTEPVANFQVLYELLQKYKNDAQEYVICTTGKGSKLWDLAQAKGFSALEIPKPVGGRYSVFSAVGIFPLALAGIDTGKLLEGAALMRDNCLNRDLKSNPAALSALMIYLLAKRGVNILDSFLFSKDLESAGRWYRQLLGESIGKELDNEGKQVFAGLTPTVSIGTTDLHSVGQLYLGGPYDKLTYFISTKSSRKSLTIPAIEGFEGLVPEISGKSMDQVMDAILDGVKAAYATKDRPFASIILPDKSPGSIGQLLQMRMMEMMFLGKLFNVNPFDQPNVESYKIEAKKNLSGQG